jgi:hypothetical protein
MLASIAFFGWDRSDVSARSLRARIALADGRVDARAQHARRQSA